MKKCLFAILIVHISYWRRLKSVLIVLLQFKLFLSQCLFYLNEFYLSQWRHLRRWVIQIHEYCYNHYFQSTIYIWCESFKKLKKILLYDSKMEMLDSTMARVSDSTSKGQAFDSTVNSYAVTFIFGVLLI